MIATQYFKVQGGILVPVYRDADYDWSALMAEEVDISLAEFGLVVTVGELEIPIPEALFDYISDNPTIVFYHVTDNRLLAEPAATVVIDKNLFMEAKGAYKFALMSRGEKDDAPTGGDNG